jgi:1-acyl-sn-glycerol-3-phosphate acyltransferase
MLLWIYAILAAANAAVLAITQTLYTSFLGCLAIVGIGIGTFVGLLILYLLFIVIVSLFIRIDRPVVKRNRFICAMVVSFLKMYLKIMRVKVETVGMEKVPNDTRFLLVNNHRSMVDPMIMMALFARHDLVFVSKKENMSIPLGGKYIHAYGSLAVDRSSLRSAAALIHDATAALKEDRVSLGIYPEGERNKTQAPLLSFKEGAFMIARRAGVPIVVTVLKGMEDLKKNKFRRTTRVTMEVVHVIDTETIKANRPNVICEMVYAQMYEALTGELPPKKEEISE